METLKKGSQGEEVKKLQELLAMSNCDGIFGPATEAAVTQFQYTHTDVSGNKLIPDGIVGAKTWAALLAEPATKEQGSSVNITMLSTPQVFTQKANRSIKYIAIHYTAGSSSAKGSARKIRDVFLTRLKQKAYGSTDFAVDDAEIVQFNPNIRCYYGWSVGDKKNPYSGGATLYGVATNSNTISIEICSNLRKGTSASAANHSGWTLTEASLANAVKLVKYLMKAYKIPVERVVRHYDISGKLCPGIVGWNNAPIYEATTGINTGKKSTSLEWEKFKERLA